MNKDGKISGDIDEYFFVQVGALKGRGGVETAIFSYGNMFDQLGARSACLYRGPGAADIRASGLRLLELPEFWMGPLSRLPGIGRAQYQAIVEASDGRTIVFIVHSDRALPKLRRLFPDAIFVTPCHSDKTKGKQEADLAITLNPAQHQRVAAGLRGSKCRAVMLGNPFQVQDEPAPAAGVTRIVFCARFIEVKNPLAVIRAHAAMTAPPELVMIGDGPLMGEARAAAGEGVTFLGWQNDPWSLISASDILVTPSSWEGLPYLVLEALGRGVPVVASDIVAHSTALGDGAFGAMFALGDHDALVEALTNAVADIGALREKALLGRQSVIDRFSPPAFWRLLSAELSAVRQERKS